MSTSEILTGDAFEGDVEEERVFGTEITSANASVSLLSEEDVPESKCTTVSYMKIEAVPADCRNLLCASGTYICYSVRKNLLRVIHTVSTEKGLLRGHESPALDLKFSPADRSVLCTADGGGKTFVWQMVDESSEGLGNKMLLNLKLSATNVQPHPKHSEVWAISNGSHIAIVSTAMGANSADIASYEQIPLHTTISGGSVTDLSFSGDGSYVAAAVTITNGQSSVEIWRLPTTELLLQGQGALTKFPTTITTPDLLAMKFLTCGVVTASRATVVEHGSSKMLNILVQVWPFDESRAAKSILSTATQRVNVSLPLHGDSKDALTTTTQLALSSTDRFLVLSHRQSNLVVCLAIDPNIHAHTHYIPNGPRVPIIHATFLDLKWPVFSADTTIFAVKDHFSAAAMEHLEISCYQEQAGGQAAVQQYHVPCASLCSSSRIAALSLASPTGAAATAAAAAAASSASVPTDALSGLLQIGASAGRSILSVLSPLPSASAVPVDIPPPPAALAPPVFPARMTTQDSLEIPPASPAAIAATTSGTAGLSETAAKSTSGQTLLGLLGKKEPAEPATTATKEQQPLGDLASVLNSGDVQGRSILNMISQKSEKTQDATNGIPAPLADSVARAFSPSIIPDASAPAPAPAAAPVPAAVPTVVTPPVPAPAPAAKPAAVSVPEPKAATKVAAATVPAPAVPAATTPTPAAPGASDGKNASVLNLLLSTLQKNQEKSAATSQTVASPREAVPLSPVATEVPQKSPHAVAATASHTASPPATATATATATVPAPAPTPVRTPAPAPAAAPVAVPVAVSVPVVDHALSAKVDELSQNMQSMMQMLAELKNSGVASAAAKAGGAAATADASAASLKSFKTELLKEVRDLLNSNNTAAQRNAASNNEAIVKATSDAVSQVAKRVVEQECKKVVEDVLKSSVWKDQLSAQLSETFQRDLAPQISQRVRDSVKETVRDTVKGALASTFRSAFENTLLPAFQAGTDRMFAQIQQTFEIGVEGLVEEGRRTQEISIAAQVEMQEEIARLRATVENLERKLEGTASVQAAGAASPAVKALGDPIALLEQGRISDAVECALEWKDTKVLITLLERLTPASLAASCNRLVQLCTAQQLAGDMGSQEPKEGLLKRLEWLKNLVMALLLGPAAASAQDPSAEQYMVPVLTGMLGNLSATEARINERIVESATAGDAQATQMLTASLTDLKMLTAVIASKTN